MSYYNATAFIIDDQDPSLQYSPGWTRTNDNTDQYLSTLSGATLAGMTVTVMFTGQYAGYFMSFGLVR